MPIYEYVCQSCGKTTEVIRTFREKPLRICPHCAGRLKKAASAPAIHFKGSGWYVTDYAGKKEQKGAESGKEEPSKAETAKTESKAEAPGAVSSEEGHEKKKKKKTSEGS